jgi:hypothetical protein
LRAAGSAACWRVAGAKAGAGIGNGETGAAAAACCVGIADVGLAGVVLGTILRAIGRGFGNGTFGLAQASTEMADSPTASTRPVASAVDRYAAARAERVTAFLCGGESFTR